MKTMNFVLPSKRLLLSYVFDWIIIIAIAAVGAGWNSITPFHRPFSVVDLSISFPFEKHETIPTWLLMVVSLVVPAAIIFIVCLVFVPGPTVSTTTPKGLIWRRKIWEWNTGWMGLALSLATAFMLTQGMKLLFGKPRPDLLSRCQPDLDQIRRVEVSTAGRIYDASWVLVTGAICTNQESDILQDGFKSFPSGHSSFSWAGLLYLTLFLASKFAVAIPFLPPRPFSTNGAFTSAASPSNLRPKSILPTHVKPPIDSTLSGHTPPENIVLIRNHAAAPPVYTLVVILVPIGSAIYISSTRFTDYRHHGFDIIFGSLIGIVCAWFSFRWYHPPIRRGAGWSWGPRSYQRAWGIGVGVGGYVGTEGWTHRTEPQEEVHDGPAFNGNKGVADSGEQAELPRTTGDHRNYVFARFGAARAQVEIILCPAEHPVAISVVSTSFRSTTPTVVGNMAEYWKSTPKYWCKFCSAYVKDTKFERSNHEATGRHQSAIQRSLRGLHRDQQNQERQKQRAKDEVARLNGLVSKSDSAPVGPTACEARAGSKPMYSREPERKATLEDRKRQWNQLTAMGITVPEEVRGDMGIGTWHVVSQRIINEEDDKKLLSVGVHKRKIDEEDEEVMAAEETIMKKGWGSTYKSYPGKMGGGDADIDRLFKKVKKPAIKKEADVALEPEIKTEESGVKGEAEESVLQNIPTEEEPTANPKEPTCSERRNLEQTRDVAARTEEETSTEGFKRIVNPGGALTTNLESSTLAKAGDGGPTPAVVFKKRKKIGR
ncbi:PAP2-domain-containing protein [Lindgomyces ingoldianus]|uniref:PAP2-domain-containing protein n=1 Tax=Lindgomyces ingoldianus TaxID=673940 RepID=A0ACB6R0H3_9PLEO|nr:PAP2-domain-containing protein [Lindgomyces ingoldianus]KAF2471951.1 PAP2-domain-containing protein [Lindgomyces ingoldianus]